MPGARPHDGLRPVARTDAGGRPFAATLAIVCPVLAAGPGVVWGVAAALLAATLAMLHRFGAAR